MDTLLRLQSCIWEWPCGLLQRTNMPYYFFKKLLPLETRIIIDMPIYISTMQWIQILVLLFYSTTQMKLSSINKYYKSLDPKALINKYHKSLDVEALQSHNIKRTRNHLKLNKIKGDHDVNIYTL